MAITLPRYTPGRDGDSPGDQLRLSWMAGINDRGLEPGSDYGMSLDRGKTGAEDGNLRLYCSKCAPEIFSSSVCPRVEVSTWA